MLVCGLKCFLEYQVKHFYYVNREGGRNIYRERELHIPGGDEENGGGGATCLNYT